MKTLLFTLLLVGITFALVSNSPAQQTIAAPAAVQAAPAIQVQPSIQIQQPIRIEVPTQLMKNVEVVPITGNQITIRNEVSVMKTPPPPEAHEAAHAHPHEVSPSPTISTATVPPSRQ